MTILMILITLFSAALLVTFIGSLCHISASADREINRLRDEEDKK